jgi:prolyl-tRNA editing enzyme YbaK/EbsC (Cys-tRNA(Pro) deacylase)
MKLDLSPALSRPDLLAKPVAAALADWPGGADTEVAPIDPDLADTAAFCEHYEVGLAESANCVVVAGKRGGVTSYAACLVTAVTRADVNGVVRRRMDARKATFAPLDDVVAATGMEYGGITPVGLPDEWPIFIDARVVKQEHVVIGSGIRGSKLWLPGPSLATLPGAEVIEGLANPIS